LIPLELFARPRIMYPLSPLVCYPQV